MDPCNVARVNVCACFVLVVSVNSVCPVCLECACVLVVCLCYVFVVVMLLLFVVCWLHGKSCGVMLVFVWFVCSELWQLCVVLLLLSWNCWCCGVVCFVLWCRSFLCCRFVIDGVV